MWSFSSSWRSFPRWLKVLTFGVGLPAWLGFAALVATGSLFEHETATFALFGAFAAVCVCHLIYRIKATLRNGQ